MMDFATEKLAAKITYIGTPFVTLFLLTGTNTDPVNVTKLAALGGVAIGLLLITLKRQTKYLWANFHFTILGVVGFVIAILNSISQSQSPLVQNLYGTYGRNTGAIAYLFLVALLFSSLQISQIEHFRKIVFGLFFAGIINVIYCGWVLVFGDFIPWDNPYGKILGLFGNPDFISAFLGMFIVACMSFFWRSEITFKQKIILFLACSFALFEIIKSHAIQGLVVTTGGIAIVIFFVIRDVYCSRKIEVIYIISVAILGFTAILGTLQKGPLKFVYKTSVSLRGSYWHAGIGMGEKFPLSGVGMDAYGDWYRRTRPPIALVNMPGVNTVSNASHNVFIDFFAYGGFPLLLTYLFLLFIGALSILRVVRRNRKYNAVFVALSATWACYQVQSIVSINQIGLAIWGWVLTGTLIAFEFVTRPETRKEGNKSPISKSRVKNSIDFLSPHLVASTGVLLGIFVASPPLNADAKWFQALNSQNAVQVEKALEPSFLNPSDSYKFALAVNLFTRSNLDDLAYKYAKQAVEFNPEYFPAWKQLYYTKKVTPEEQQRSLMNMKRLDPLNRNVTALE